MQSWTIFVDFRECLANSKYSLCGRPADGKNPHCYSNSSVGRKMSTLRSPNTHGSLQKIIQFRNTSRTLPSEQYRKSSKRKNLTPISVGEVRSGKTHELCRGCDFDD